MTKIAIYKNFGKQLYTVDYETAENEQNIGTRPVQFAQGLF